MHLRSKSDIDIEEEINRQMRDHIKNGVTIDLLPAKKSKAPKPMKLAAKKAMASFNNIQKLIARYTPVITTSDYSSDAALISAAKFGYSQALGQTFFGQRFHLNKIEMINKEIINKAAKSFSAKEKQISSDFLLAVEMQNEEIEISLGKQKI